MKKLKDILYRVSIDAVRGNTDIDVTGLAFDSRKVEPGMVFIAQKGTQSDGHQFIGQAIAAGAKTVIYENEPIDYAEHITYVRVEDADEALAQMASNYYD